MIRVRYFARYREMLDCEQEEMELPDSVQTIADLMLVLSQRGNRWPDVFSGDQRILAAINQDMVQADAVIKNGDEVAFFPPVTGG